MSAQRTSSRFESTSRPSRPEYMHTSNAVALEYEEEQTFGVVAGRRRASAIETLPRQVIVAARILVAIAAAIALVCCVRVALTAASVSTSLESSAMSAQIETARSTGNDLEVQQSQLSNSMHVRLAASSLGMAAPAETAAVVLTPDIVVTDETGALSLSGSLAAIASQG